MILLHRPGKPPLRVRVEARNRPWRAGVARRMQAAGWPLHRIRQATGLRQRPLRAALAGARLDLWGAAETALFKGL